MKLDRARLTLIISPHPDDLAFSIGGTILKGRRSTGKLAVTVFTRSSYGPFGCEGLSTEQISARRRDEDRRFFKTVGIPYVHLDFPDTTLRGYPNFESAREKERASDDPIFPTVRDTLRNLAELIGVESVILPLGVGNHIDHLISRDALRFPKQGWNYIYYEDVPYTTGFSLTEIDELARRVDAELRPFYTRIRDVISIKMRNLRLYASQVGKEEINLAMAHCKRLGPREQPAERIWSCRRFEF